MVITAKDIKRWEKEYGPLTADDERLVMRAEWIKQMSKSLWK